MKRLERRMENLWDGVKGIVRKNGNILVLVKRNGLHYSAKLTMKLA